MAYKAIILKSGRIITLHDKDKVIKSKDSYDVYDSSGNRIYCYATWMVDYVTGFEMKNEK